MRFRPEQHLRRPTDIRCVREQGRRIDCGAYTVWWKKRAVPASASLVDQSPRVCVIASIKAVGGAILRNRAKRRLREVFRHHQRHVPAACDLLLVARAGITTRSVSELEEKFVEACHHIETQMTLATT